MNRVFQVAIAVATLGLAAVTASPAQADSTDLLRDANVAGLDQLSVVRELAAPVTGALGGTLGQVSRVSDAGAVGGRSVQGASGTLAPLFEGEDAFGGLLGAVDLRQAEGLTNSLPSGSPAEIAGNPLDALDGLLSTIKGTGGPFGNLSDLLGATGLTGLTGAAGLGGLTESAGVSGPANNAPGLVGVTGLPGISDVTGSGRVIGAVERVAIMESAPDLVSDLVTAQVKPVMPAAPAGAAQSARIDEIAPLVDSAVSTAKAGTSRGAITVHESLDSVAETAATVTGAIVR
ncbi:hypothetical protein [Nonomuraea sp. NPDC046570]|uniref:hypothetical protein n=1 Tax=Nonomuraea sp. NPDC046570 TaxID=3155255 RepID=UPI0033F78434